MKEKLFYEMIGRMYDWLDIMYFSKEDTSPRTGVIDYIGKDDKVLDLCTGTGTVAIRIAAANPRIKVVGVDQSMGMLRMAKHKKEKQQVRNLKLYPMDATKMNFHDQSFDKVLISLVLHELDDKLAENLILEAKRVLREQGEIILTEWEPPKAWWRKLMFAPISVLEPKPYRTFVKKDLIEYFRRYGLKVIGEKHCDYTKVLRIIKEEVKDEQI